MRLNSRLEAAVPPGLKGEGTNWLNEMVDDFVRESSMYFGDHIDWDQLHKFKMPELYDSKNIKEESNTMSSH